MGADLGTLTMGVSKPGAHRRRESQSREMAGPVLGQWPFLIVLAIAVAGLAVVASDHFRRGTVLFAAAICLAALLRAALPSRAAGLLRVRGRIVDALTLTALGAATLLAALVVPPPS